MWKLIRKESEGFQRSVGAAPDDDESDDEAQPRTQTRASAFSRISETLRNRPRVSGDRDDGTVENLGDHVPLPAFDPNAVISRRTTSNKRPRVGNSSSCVLDQADASGDDGEEEQEFDNASQDSRFVSDHHLSDDEEDSDLAQHGFHIQNMISR